MNKMEQVKSFAGSIVKEIRAPRDYDDKDLVIICVTVIVLFSLFAVSDPVQIVRDALIGMFGVAVGRTGKA